MPQDREKHADAPGRAWPEERLSVDQDRLTLQGIKARKANFAAPLVYLSSRSELDVTLSELSSIATAATTGPIAPVIARTTATAL